MRSVLRMLRKELRSAAEAVKTIVLHGDKDRPIRCVAEGAAAFPTTAEAARPLRNLREFHVEDVSTQNAELGTSLGVCWS